MALAGAYQGSGGGFHPPEVFEGAEHRTDGEDEWQVPQSGRRQRRRTRRESCGCRGVMRGGDGMSRDGEDVLGRKGRCGHLFPSAPAGVFDWVTCIVGFVAFNSTCLR